MKRTYNVFKIAIVLVVCLVMLSLTACSEPVTVSIVDSGETTQFDADTSMTVEQVLTEAKITLGEKDEVVPAKDEKLTAETKEITIKRYAKVTIIKDDEEKTVELVGGTVSDALKKAEITLLDNELTDVNSDAILEDGMEINVLRKLNVTLKVDGETKKIETVAKTVEEVLNIEKITLGEHDEVSPKLDKALEEGMKITVKRVEYKEETRTETIDYKTKEEYSSSMAQGTSKVTQQGVEGKKEVTYKVKYVDSKEKSKEVISEKVIKEPTDKIVTYGTKQAASNSSSSSGSNSGSNSGSSNGGKTIVSKQRVEDCDGSGHGYYVITYSDGSVEYVDF